MSTYLALACPERTRRLRAVLPEAHRLEAFTGVDGLLRRLEEVGPPAGLVLARLPQADERRRTLQALRTSLPGCPRLLWTDGNDVAAVAEVLEHGGITRLVADDPGPRELRHGLLALREASERRRRELLELERLDFAHDVLRETVQALEQHIDDVRRDASDVERLVVGLRASSSIATLTRVAAETMALRLPGRGVHVAVEVAPRGELVEAKAGLVEGRVLLRLPLRGIDGDLGVVEIVGETQGPVLSAAERTHVQACEPMITLATQGMIHRAERNDAQLATVLGLARLAEHRDDTTGRHLERVSRYCRLLATGLRDAGLYRDVLSTRYIDDLELSAPLHDIGKVAVPDAILLKPGRLDEEEWQVMRSHAELGAQAIETILASTGEQPYLRMGLEIARGHHERWDGAGYPRGLRETEIPLCARIMAIADVYDALTSPRPYKEAWSHERAVQHVVDLSGQQFDPELVAVFVELAPAFDAVRADCADVEAARASA